MLQRAYVEITNVCNLRCSFCPGTKREKKFIEPAEFRVLAEKLRLWTDYLYLHVMGEPLLHPALGEILDECDRLGFRVCVTTNGVLLPSRLAVLRGRRCLHKVSVSLHSFEGNGGDGWIRILEFMPDGVTVKATTFSPLFAISPTTRQFAWMRDAKNEFTFRFSK